MKGHHPTIHELYIHISRRNPPIIIRLTRTLPFAFFLFCALTLTTTTLVTHAAQMIFDSDHRKLRDGESVKVFIKYKNTTQGKQLVLRAIAAAAKENTNSTMSIRQGIGFLKRLSALEATFTRDELIALESDPNIEYIEDSPNRKRYLFATISGEAESWGLRAVRSDLSQSTLPIQSGDGACSNPDSLRVGIVDSGVDTSHPDLACTSGVNCIGKAYGVGNLKWNRPSDSHGTGVAGIMMATRGNSEGVAGVADGRSICWLVSRVFEGTTSQANMVDVLDGIEWVVDEGARVINLSLGGSSGSRIERDYYERLSEQGIIVSAASGNDGTSGKMYPASYSSVLSVGAVNASKKWAYFSNHNGAVNLVAPGTAVLTTSIQEGKELIWITAANGKKAVGGTRMGSSAEARGQTGPLVDCGNGQEVCSSATNAVCLIYRFEDSNNFGLQANNCQEGGGVAAIIYNNEDGAIIKGKLKGYDITIPVAAITDIDGAMLKTSYLGETIKLSITERYTEAWGTSFAAPFASGTAAAVLVACPLCSRSNVIECMQGTALDIGDRGHDEYYGYGLLRVENTYVCLRDTKNCCGDTLPPTPAPTAAYTGNLPCLDERIEYRQCQKDKFTQEETKNCNNCANLSEDTIVRDDCGSLNERICAGLLGPCETSCKACSTELKLFYKCLVETVKSSSNCKLGCVTPRPTPLPTRIPSASPSASPTTLEPSAVPSHQPSTIPSESPSASLSSSPSATPSATPSSTPSSSPIASPSAVPSPQPSSQPTAQPTTLVPSSTPTAAPSSKPTMLGATSTPTNSVAAAPGSKPSEARTAKPSSSPTEVPHHVPSATPTRAITKTPSSQPTNVPIAPTGAVATSPIIPTTTEVPSRVPTIKTTVAPTVNTAPADPPVSVPAADCSQELDTARACLDNEIVPAEKEACKSCVNTHIPPSSAPCGFVEEKMCPPLSYCDCGTCKQKVVEYFTCSFRRERGCPFDCSDVLEEEEMKAPVTGQSDNCEAELGFARDCLGQMDPTAEKECKDCVNSNIPPLVSSCEVIEAQMCPPLDYCDCGICKEKVVDYFTCTYQKREGCPFDCEAHNSDDIRSGGPAGCGAKCGNEDVLSEDNLPSCSVEQQAFQSCVSELSPFQSERCHKCQKGMLPEDDASGTQEMSTANDCSKVDSTSTCSTLKDCDCGICATLATKYTLCKLGALASGSECEVGCGEDTVSASKSVTSSSRAYNWQAQIWTATFHILIAAIAVFCFA